MQNTFTRLCTDSHDAKEGQRREESGEDEQQQADAVDADRVGDAERRNPGVALDELEVAGRRVEPAPQKQCLRKHQQRDDERDAARRRSMPALSVTRLADEQQQDGADDRQRDQRGEDRKTHQRLINTKDTKDTKAKTVCPPCPSCPLCLLIATGNTQG